MFNVNFTSFAVNKNVVQIALHEIVNVISQNVVYIMLIINEFVNEFK